MNGSKGCLPGHVEARQSHLATCSIILMAIVELSGSSCPLVMATIVPSVNGYAMTANLKNILKCTISSSIMHVLLAYNSLKRSSVHDNTAGI